MSTPRSWVVLGQQLRGLRRDLDIPQRKAAREMGLDLATLDALEHGKTGLSGAQFQEVLVWMSNQEGVLEGLRAGGPGGQP